MARAFALVLLVAMALSPALAAATGPAGGNATPGAVTTAPVPSSTIATTDRHARPDPPQDTIGWENGYWYDDPIDVDQSDGLNRTERRVFVARAMARVEYIRQREFTKSVPVDVESRQSFRNGSSGGSSAEYEAWNAQVWEALLVLGEDTDAQQSIEDTVGSSVAGYYSPSSDAIKVITPTPDRPTIDNATLVHELVHALQDQRYNLSAPQYTRQTQDGDLALDGVVEGEAAYVEQLYARHCANGWSCVAPAGDSGGGSGGGGGGPNLGVLLTIYQPYSDGPAYVDALHEAGGWDAVDAAYASPPVSSEQVIHHTDERPTPLDFEDRATGGWKTFPDQGQNGSDTVGEASIFVLFWYQTYANGADVVDMQQFSTPEGPFDRYDYRSQPSAGWANDRLFPYRKNTTDGTRYGYVWETAWDSPEDATQFREAYVDVLTNYDTERVGAHAWRVTDGPFEDAFSVRQNGSRVTIVNGPTVDSLSEIRPGVDPRQQSTDTNGVPGFTALTALTALLAAALLAGWR